MNSIFSSIQETTRVYIVRHAESEYNAQNLVAGRAETPLTQKGISQAIETGKFLSDKKISLILHSPLIRTTQTAINIKDQFSDTSIPLIEQSSLVEMDSGVFTHKNIHTIAKEDPNAYHHFKIHSWSGVEQAESIDSLLSRCRESWNTIAEYANQGHRDILLVTHGGYMQWLFKTSFGFSGAHVESWAPIIRTNNCGVHKLEIEPVIGTLESGVFALWELLNYICYN